MRAIGWRKMVIALAAIIPAYFIHLTEVQANVITDVAIIYIISNAGKAAVGGILEKIRTGITRATVTGSDNTWSAVSNQPDQDLYNGPDPGQCIGQTEAEGK